jgi:hypothetical protein
MRMAFRLSVVTSIVAVNLVGAIPTNGSGETSLKPRRNSSLAMAKLVASPGLVLVSCSANLPRDKGAQARSFLRGKLASQLPNRLAQTNDLSKGLHHFGCTRFARVQIRLWLRKSRHFLQDWRNCLSNHELKVESRDVERIRIPVFVSFSDGRVKGNW